MKTLILNGSPRKKGDTAALLAVLKNHLAGEVEEISAYNADISPCIDCRYCWKKFGCSIDDEMKKIYDGGYDNIVIASPVHMRGFPGPMVNIVSRFQVYDVAERFHETAYPMKEKKAVLIMTGGGGGSPKYPISLARWMFRMLNAQLDEGDIILSLDTDNVPAGQDHSACLAVEAAAERLNGPI